MLALQSQNAPLEKTDDQGDSISNNTIIMKGSNRTTRKSISTLNYDSPLKALRQSSPTKSKSDIKQSKQSK